jgi:hypothetical protein
VVSVLATGPNVRGFDLDLGRWIFKGDKNPEHHFLRRGSKAVVDFLFSRPLLSTPVFLFQCRG